VEACGPLWVRFKISHSRVVATLKLHLSTRFRVLVENGFGKPLTRIALGVLHAGLTRVRFRFGHLAPGSYRLLIQALPPDKNPVLGPNPLILHLDRNGSGDASFFTPRPEGQRPLLKLLASQRCVVPTLKGLSLEQARNALKAASCRLGMVTGRANGWVKNQKPMAGKVIGRGSTVSVTLG
jgi:hypothetical protein